MLYLIQNRDRLVRKNEILDSIWLEASVAEGTLTRSIGLLRKALEDDSRQPRFIETVPTAGYRFIAVVRVLDQVPHSTSPTTSPIAKPSPEQDQSTVKSPRIIRTILLIGCIVMLITAIGWFHQKRLRAARGIRSLAVLPLENLSGDPSQEYFADGMTDELTTMLAKDSTLRIVSRTSAMQFKDAHRSLPEIARALNVDAILEGSISRSSKKVHMTLQLVRSETDSHLWAESYDRDPNDVAVLPDNAARAIAARLNSSTPSHVNARYIKPDAHDAYLRGHYSWVVGRNEDAGRYYQQAVQIQPDYALGWTGLADYYAMEALSGKVDPLQALRQAEAAARKAVELDDSVPRAHTALGGMIFFNHGDSAQALNELARATELDSHDGEGFHLYARILCALGHYDEAIAVQKQSTAINPFEHPGAMAEVYACTRRFDAAISDGEMRLKDFPAAPDILMFLAASYHWKGRDKEAVEMLARQISAEGNLPLSAAVRRAFETGGYTAVVRRQLASVENKERTGRVSTFVLADLHGKLSEHDETLALLEQCANERDPLSLLLTQSDPAFDFLHSDSRYRSLIQKMGLPPMY